MQIFVILQNNIEYHDDRCFRYADGYSAAIDSYRSHEAALNELHRLNAERCGTRNVFEYNDPDDGDAFDEDKLENIRDYLDMSEDDLSDFDDLNNMWDDLTSDQRRWLWEQSNVDHQLFYSIQELPLSDCQVREPAAAT
jgi:hypothetical protein